MKYLKILGLAAVVAAALMAFAGTASATELTSPLGTRVNTGTVIKAVSEGKPALAATFGTIKCNSTVEGKTTNETGTSISGSISTLSWTNCEPEPCSATTLKTGTLSITSSGNGNGTLTGNGQEVTTECFGLHCIWSTSNTTLGTVTGSANTSGTATLDISATINRTGGRSGAFCGSTGTWSGSYSVTAPDPLYID